MENEAPRRSCGTCSSLSDQEYGFQKYGSDGDTHLPAIVEKLEVVQDLRPSSSRKQQVWRCPECGTHYLYETDYEYLVNGSEDEEFLTRLTDEQAAEYLERPRSATEPGD
jgi:hypothetical protein